MTKLTLSTTDSRYDIFVGDGALRDALPQIVRKNSGTKALVVTDTNVGPLYAGDVKNVLTSCGYDAHVFEFPAGEKSKQMSTVMNILASLAENEFTRKDMIVALGGGVTGDMAGFAASMWMRGMDFVQIPTSLLAQVDSSIGGKTGVDLPQGKNLVGAFWQPIGVVADTVMLSTLPDVFFTDGMAEVIKSACIKDAGLFESLENGTMSNSDMVARCIDIKRVVVQNDERENGERKLLNFGHTLAHALEKHHDFEMSHGRAVAVGMAYITQMSEKMGISSVGTHDRLCAVLKKYNLPVCDDTKIADFLPHILMDKKRSGDSVDTVLLEEIGKAVVFPVKTADFSSFLYDGGVR